jgi:hypothetical protein
MLLTETPAGDGSTLFLPPSVLVNEDVALQLLFISRGKDDILGSSPRYTPRLTNSYP